MNKKVGRPPATPKEPKQIAPITSPAPTPVPSFKSAKMQFERVLDSTGAKSYRCVFLSDFLLFDEAVALFGKNALYPVTAEVRKILLEGTDANAPEVTSKLAGVDFFGFFFNDDSKTSVMLYALGEGDDNFVALNVLTIGGLYTIDYLQRNSNVLDVFYRNLNTAIAETTSSTQNLLTFKY